MVLFELLEDGVDLRVRFTAEQLFCSSDFFLDVITRHGRAFVISGQAVTRVDADIAVAKLSFIAHFPTKSLNDRCFIGR